MATNVPCGPDTPISVKVILEKNTRKFKIAFSELGPDVLPAKLRSLLDIPDGLPVKFQRWSDSGSAYEELDPSDSSVFKKLARAARAKLKLRIKATVPLMPTAFTPYSLPTQHPALASEVTLTNANGTVNMLPSPQILSPIRIPSTADVTVTNNSRLSLASSNISPTATTITQNYKSQLFRDLAVRPKLEVAAAAIPTSTVAPPAVGWSVYCNVCDKQMPHEHYHCDSCDGGDYDLCQDCIDAGHICPGEGHWLIKRIFKDGRVITSTTERVMPKPKSTVVDVPSEMPGAYTDDKKAEAEAEEEEDEQEEELPSRTCNACVNVFSEDYFVTCQECEDFDLCLPCHEANVHGHHPGHTFKPATPETVLSSAAQALCAPGRNVRHAAICDGCDKPIYGVRHKCLTCPDWDYCTECVRSVRYIHPNHRFAALYDPISEPHGAIIRHVGIFCDGPLCKGKDSQQYIIGTRYKCAMCNDKDFCGNCEASPRNHHNRSHPLIKIKIPIRNVSITALEGDENGVLRATKGDKFAFVHTTAPNAPSPIRTVADVKPSEPVAIPKTEKIQIKDLLAEPIEEKIKVEDLKPTPIQISSQELTAHYVRDTIKDASIMTPSQKFVQVWTLRNPGPHAWPAGCVVSWVGGDHMFDLDDSHPSSEADLVAAQRTNVVGRPVEVGEEIAFRVMLKAPKKEGTAISYWRLKAADGVIFGHRLWCHIKVVAAPQLPNYTPSPSPAHVSPPVSVPTVERTESVGRPKMNDDFLQLLLRNQEHQARLLAQKAAEFAKQRVEAAEKKRKEFVEKESHAQILNAVRKEIEAANKQATFEHIQPLINAAVSVRPAVEKEQKEATAAAELAATTPSVKVEAVPATVETEDGKTEGSAMIFPKLEKESPSSSTHQSLKTAEEPKTPETTNAAPAAVTSPSVKTETDIFDDAESVAILDSSDEDGFLTEEEYDILDASDEEHIV